LILKKLLISSSQKILGALDMKPKSIYDVFRLSSVVKQGFVHVLAFLHPLELVAACDNRPRLIVTYDRDTSRRADLGIQRIIPQVTHMNVTILPGDGKPPVCAAFGAACLLETPHNGEFRKVNPHLKKEAEVTFGPLKYLSPWRVLMSPNFAQGVEGQVIDESWRHGDSFMSVVLKDEKQVAGALKVIEEWRASPPKYALHGLQGKNCKGFVGAVIEGAGVRKPLWWDIIDWPALDASVIEFISGGKLTRRAEWLFQPRVVTNLMSAAAREAHGRLHL
jgi:hypothetical protein